MKKCQVEKYIKKYIRNIWIILEIYLNKIKLFNAQNDVGDISRKISTVHVKKEKINVCWFVRCEIPRVYDFDWKRDMSFICIFYKATYSNLNTHTFFF